MEGEKEEGGAREEDGGRSKGEGGGREGEGGAWREEGMEEGGGGICACTQFSFTAVGVWY